MQEAIRRGDIPGVQLRRRRDLELSREAAWRWLVEAERLGLWLAPKSRLRVDEGGWTIEPTSGGIRRRARTIELSPPGFWSLSFEEPDSSWGAATLLTLELESAVDGCSLSVLQEGFQRLPLSECLTIWEAYRRWWSEALERLARLTTPTFE